jgi:ribose 5-phosphate isomerase B
MKIAFGCDHAGFDIKEKLISYIKSIGNEVIDCGTDSSTSCDYPDFALKVAQNIVSKKADKGILICGTGIGMSIAANKIKGIRAAVCWSKETATLISQHNNANIMCAGARFASVEDICSWIKIFIETKFEERHLKRINKISLIEQQS